MICFLIRGFGKKSSQLLTKLLLAEEKFQKKQQKGASTCLIVTIPDDTRMRVEISATSEFAFAQACAMIYSVAQSTPGPILVTSTWLKRTVRIGPRRPPHVD